MKYIFHNNIKKLCNLNQIFLLKIYYYFLFVFFPETFIYSIYFTHIILATLYAVYVISVSTSAKLYDRIFSVLKQLCWILLRISKQVQVPYFSTI